MTGFSGGIFRGGLYRGGYWGANRVFREGGGLMRRMITGAILSVLVWLLALPALTFLLGIPACLYLVNRQSRGALMGFVGWIVAAEFGWVPTFQGPFGLPSLVFWPATAVFSVWFGIGFAVMSRAAWRHAIRANRLMRDYGMPASEII